MFPLALMAGSALASGIGALGSKSAQDKYLLQNLQADQQQIMQDAEAARLRNEVLAKYREVARGFGAENESNFAAGMTPFTQGAQAGRLDAATGARGGAINEAIGSATPTSDIPLRAGAPDVVRQAYTGSLGDAFIRAQGQGGRLADVGAYGDTMGANARDIGGTGQRVETVNTLAKGNAKLLPAEQDLMAYQANRPIFRPAQPDTPWWSTVLKGAGKLGGAMAGRSF